MLPSMGSQRTGHDKATEQPFSASWSWCDESSVRAHSLPAPTFALDSIELQSPNPWQRMVASLLSRS